MNRRAFLEGLFLGRLGERKRGSYRRAMAAEIADVEHKARRAGVTLTTLADRAGVPIATLRRMRRTGLAFPRQVVALRQALRALLKDVRQAGALFDGVSDAD